MLIYYSGVRNSDGKKTHKFMFFTSCSIMLSYHDVKKGDKGQRRALKTISTQRKK